MSRLWCLSLGLGMLLTSFAFAADDKTASEWKSIWDGKTFTGWKASENKDSWSIKDGILTCHGERSHLFYVGDDKPIRNFEFECEVMTEPGSNAGIYFHTKYQETGWPKYGYECQVNISHKDPKKSGGLYATADVANPPVKDGEWYKNYIKVEGRHVIIRINDTVTTDYTEPEGKEAFSKDFERRLGEGTIAFQAHDPDSKVHFRNIRLRHLP
ncbi:MAG: DUF1080 domain-containing protein [Planctomycetaceae bacterium]|nr:DUF1080 domain-containing protein [Planctomycetaceae bacterium]